MKPEYHIETWDSEAQTWSPQPGVRSGPYTLFGLRKAIRKLRKAGYPCNYDGKYGGDPSVKVTRRGPCR